MTDPDHTATPAAFNPPPPVPLRPRTRRVVDLDEDLSHLAVRHDHLDATVSSTTGHLTAEIHRLAAAVDDLTRQVAELRDRVPPPPTDLDRPDAGPGPTSDDPARHPERAIDPDGSDAKAKKADKTSKTSKAKKGRKRTDAAHR
jgi:hypothetical protein